MDKTAAWTAEVLDNIEANYRSALVKKAAGGHGIGPEWFQNMTPGLSAMAARPALYGLYGAGIGGVGGLLANTLLSKKKKPLESALTGALLGGLGGAGVGFGQETIFNSRPRRMLETIAQQLPEDATTTARQGPNAPATGLRGLLRDVTGFVGAPVVGTAMTDAALSAHRTMSGSNLASRLGAGANNILSGLVDKIKIEGLRNARGIRLGDSARNAVLSHLAETMRTPGGLETAMNRYQAVGSGGPSQAPGRVVSLLRRMFSGSTSPGLTLDVPRGIGAVTLSPEQIATIQRQGGSGAGRAPGNLLSRLFTQNTFGSGLTARTSTQPGFGLIGSRIPMSRLGAYGGAALWSLANARRGRSGTLSNDEIMAGADRILRGE